MNVSLDDLTTTRLAQYARKKASLWEIGEHEGNDVSSAVGFPDDDLLISKVGVTDDGSGEIA